MVLQLLGSCSAFTFRTSRGRGRGRGRVAPAGQLMAFRPRPFLVLQPKWVKGKVDVCVKCLCAQAYASLRSVIIFLAWTLGTIPFSVTPVQICSRSTMAHGVNLRHV